MMFLLSYQFYEEILKTKKMNLYFLKVFIVEIFPVVLTQKSWFSNYNVVAANDWYMTIYLYSNLFPIIKNCIYIFLYIRSFKFLLDAWYFVLFVGLIFETDTGRIFLALIHVFDRIPVIRLSVLSKYTLFIFCLFAFTTKILRYR